MAAHALRFFAHGIHHRMPFGEELLHWLLMVYAMMLPLIGGELRAAAFASLWSRRHQAMLGVLLGYSITWLLAGIPAALMREQTHAHAYAVPTIGFLAAAVWQFTPVRAYALAACHRTPMLAASGWRADRDSVWFGVRAGWPCVLSCWPIMAACAFTGHAPLAMAGCMALGLIERRSFRPRTKAAAAGAALLAGYYFFLARAGW
jgi:predicted metal-binding membrane protein